jgi:hypothetical protein
MEEFIILKVPVNTCLSVCGVTVIYTNDPLTHIVTHT